MIAQEIRPRQFNDVVGHTASILAFKKLAKDFNYPSVMFFEGATGSGKTTIANIIACTVNCTEKKFNGEYYEPCLECPSCKSVLNETYNQDIHFYNASEMTTDDVVNLENNAISSPFYGGLKNIIIVDEFQELGKKAKGATLVLLEKQRRDTIFILCTMDVSSLDKAILSRGQVYKFKPLAASEVGKVLINALTLLDPDEKIPITPEALVLLSQNCYGSARQALANLQRCIDSELYTVEQIENEIGFLSEEKGYEIFNKLLAKDVSFFDSLAKVGIESFWIYSWSIISSIHKSILTLEKDNWKYKSSQAILSSPDFTTLCDVYLQIYRDTNGWVKDSIFNYYIGKFIFNEAKPMIKTREKK